jgi:hypothetical protein
MSRGESASRKVITADMIERAGRGVKCEEEEEDVCDKLAHAGAEPDSDDSDDEYDSYDDSDDDDDADDDAAPPSLAAKICSPGKR